jgi:O-antigen/teichoic acid export membrane protein
VILKNFSFLASARVVSRLGGFCAIVYMARVLGADGYGVISFCLSYISYFEMASDMGLKTYGTRAVSRATNSINKKEVNNKNQEQKSIVQNVLTMKLVLAGASTALSLLASMLIISEKYFSVAALYTLVVIPKGLIINWFYRGVEKMKYEAFSEIGRYIVYVPLVFIFVDGYKDILLVPIFWIISVSLQSIFLLIEYQTNFGTIGLAFNFSKWYSIAKSAVYMGSSLFMIRIFKQFDIIAIGFLGTSKEVGYYSSAYKGILALGMLSTVVMNSVFPKLSSYYHNESNIKLRELFDGIVQILIAGWMPIAIGGYLLASDIITAVYGKSYLASVSSFSILSLSLLFNGVRVGYANLLMACNRERRYMINFMFSTSVNVVLNLVLIPTMGIEGAALATLVSEALLAAMMIRYTRDLVDTDISSKITIPAIGTLTISCLIYLLQSTVNLFIMLILCSIVYIAIIIYMGILKKISLSTLVN